MTVTALSVIQTVSVDRLQDATADKWPIAELCRAFNLAQRVVSLVRPDLSSKRATVTCVAGALQSLPAGGKLLLNVENNAGGNKRAVKMPRNGRSLVDAVKPNWRSLTGADEILEAYYDEREPLKFEVYPPATTAAQLVVLYSANPTAIGTDHAAGTTYADVTGNMDLQDSAEPALIELILAYAFAKDAQFSAQAARSQGHFANAASLLGVSLQSLMAASAKSDDSAGAAGAPSTST